MGNPEREPIHRIRLASFLREAPQIREMWNAGSQVRALAMSADHRLAATGGDGGVVRLFHLRDQQSPRNLLRNLGQVVNLAFSPDGTRLATLDQTGAARVWSTQSGAPLTPPLAGLRRVNYLAWHPGGRRIALGGEDGVVVWEIAPVRRVCEAILQGAEGCQPAFSPDGRKLAIVAGNFLGWMVDPESGEPLFRLARCYNGTALEFSPDGASLLLAGSFESPTRHQGAAILDAKSGVVLRYLNMPGLGLAARYSPDGRRVVVGDRSGIVRVWDPQSGTPTSPEVRLPQPVTTASFSPDGKRFLAVSRDGHATVRDAVTGIARCAPLRHGKAVTAAAFSGDGRRVLTTSQDGAARVWALPPREPPWPVTGAGEEQTLQLDHLAGDQWAVGRFPSTGDTPSEGTETVRVWSSRTGRAVAPGKWRQYAATADGRWLALAASTGVQLWDSESRKARGPLHPVDVSQAELVLQPGGRWLAAVERTAPRLLRVVDLHTGRVIPVSNEPTASVYGFFAAGRVLWFQTAQGVVKLWRLPAAGAPAAPPVRLPLPTGAANLHLLHRSGALVTAYDVGRFRVWDERGRPLSRELRFYDRHLWAPEDGVSISPDGDRVVLFALSRQGKRIHTVGTLLDLAAGTVRQLPEDDAMPMYFTAVFTPSADRFAVHSNDGEIQIWDWRSARPLTRVLHHSTILHAASFSADGRWLVTGAVDGTARVWDAATGRGRTPFLAHPAPVVAATFSPDGRLVLTRSADRSARLWDARTGEGVALPLDFGQPVDACRFLPDGRVLAHCGPRTLVRNLHPDPRPVSELARLCLLLAAHRADGNGGLQALEPEQLRKLWQTGPR